MRLAIVAPWYVANGGAEKVDGVLGEMYPDADFFALFARPQGIPAKLVGREIKTSFFNRIPGITELYRPLLSAMPLAVRSLDMHGYDVVLSSEWACVKGVSLPPNALHISYCHTPMRHVWDLYENYLHDASLWQRPVFAWSAKRLRRWDYQAAQHVDHFIANSNYIAARIRRYYGRESTVIYPPVDIGGAYISESQDDYYLSVGRLNRTKRLDLLVRACTELGRRLVISGWGPEDKNLKAIAGPTVEFAGRVPDAELPALYARCRALLFAADEDFGIVPVEAQAHGRPVIAFGRGGSLETVRVGDAEGRVDTGLFFEAQTVDAVKDAILRFERNEHRFIPVQTRAHAAQFDQPVFMEKMQRFMQSAIEEHGIR